jgi:hypothetical protein
VWGTASTSEASTWGSPARRSAFGAVDQTTLQPGTMQAGSQRARSSIGTSQVANEPLAGKPHWEGPLLIDAHCGWQSLSAVSASLPASAQPNTIK